MKSAKAAATGDPGPAQGCEEWWRHPPHLQETLRNLCPYDHLRFYLLECQHTTPKYNGNMGCAWPPF